MELQSNPGYTTFHGGVAGLAYNEAAFNHFLAIERRRAERSRRSILLVLVSVQAQAGRSNVLGHAAATELFARLGASVREVDFVGWYREGRVAAAVLTQQAPPSRATCDRVAERVTSAVRIPALAAHGRLRVRVVSLRGAAGAQQISVKQSNVKQQA
jgi:hypothetical protein